MYMYVCTAERLYIRPFRRNSHQSIDIRCQFELLLRAPFDLKYSCLRDTIDGECV